MTFKIPRWPSGPILKPGEPRTEGVHYDVREKSIWLFPNSHGCKEETVAAANKLIQREAREREEAEKQRAQMLKRAGLTGMLANHTFESFAPRADWPDSRHVVQRVLDYAEAIMSGPCSKPWLVLWGNYGTGKTHLMAATIHWAVKAGWRSYFRSWPEYLRGISASYTALPMDPGDYQARREVLVNQMASGQLVAIDDIDKRRPSAWSLDMVYEPLNVRYNNSLPTIMAFNSDPMSGKGASYIGAAILDRLFEMAYDFIEFDGPSLRSHIG